MRKKISKKLCLVSLLLSTFSGHVYAESKYLLPLSASFGVGAMKSDDLDLKSRTLTAFSFEALPSYNFGKYSIGVHLDYRFQQQLTSLNKAGGTNLKGNGYLLGIGARYQVNDRLFVQGAVDFLGAYDLSRDTAQGQDDELTKPLGLRVKTGYAFLEAIPNLTFDADLQYLTFNNIEIHSTDYSKTMSQFMVGVGVTYIFGFGKHQSPVVETQKESASKEVTPTKVSNIVGVEKVGDSHKLNITGASFESGSALLNEEAKNHFSLAAKTIAESGASVRIYGHTDNSGNEASNQLLSEKRANALKDLLIESGVEKEKVTTEGFGSKKPIAKNETSEGRAKNRRVEIFID